MTKTKWVLLLSALLFAASASAQERKVWTDADLAKPMPKLERKVDPETLAALKRRADYIPNMAGYRGGGGGGSASRASAPDAGLKELEAYYGRELAALQRRASQPPEQPLYASQPLYPYAAVVYSNRPIYPQRPHRPAPGPRSGRQGGRR